MQNRNVSYASHSTSEIEDNNRNQNIVGKLRTRTRDDDISSKETRRRLTKQPTNANQKHIHTLTHIN